LETSLRLPSSLRRTLLVFFILIVLLRSQAVSATSKGHIVVWDMSLIVDGDSPDDERRGIKVVHLSDDIPINVILVHVNYNTIIAGGVYYVLGKLSCHWLWRWLNSLL
jgi:hypothetical protein